LDFSRVAQLVERPVVNRQVIGSSHFSGAIFEQAPAMRPPEAGELMKQAAAQNKLLKPQ
jgi:hypothetical protein